MKTILRKAIASFALFTLLWSNFAYTTYAGSNPQPQVKKEASNPVSLGNDQYSITYTIKVTTSKKFSER